MSGIELEVFVQDFAACLKKVDSARPQAINARSKTAFQHGIGPHSEADVVRLVSDEMARWAPARYSGLLRLAVPYPEQPRQKCDLCIGEPPSTQWAIEIKMLRFLGDNNKINDNILMHILSPYPQHRSALTDCTKLNQSTLGQHKAVLIYGFEHDAWPLGPAIEAFESLARSKCRVGPRSTASFDNLVHPVHARGKVFAWEISAKSLV